MLKIDEGESAAFNKQVNEPNRKPVIMQVLPAMETGGAEQGCIDVAATIVQAGGTALVVSNGGPRVHELSRAGATHIELPVHSKNPIVMSRNAKKLRKLIREHNVDIVHARSRAPAWSAYKAVKGTDARFMTTCHAPYNISGKAKRYYNSVMAKGERVIAISQYVSEYLQKNYGTDPSRIRVIHRGIAIERFHPNAVTPERMIDIAREWRLPDGVNVVLLPARLTRWKGHHFLIDAVAQMDRPDVFVVIVGSDQGRTAYRRELEQYIESKKLAGRVRMVDHCSDMPAAYMLSQAVVCASLDPEGFGRVPIEAQAMGRPIIATDHGAPRETVLRNETGWLVEPGNVSELSQALSQALSLSPKQRAILGTRTMAHVAQHFTKEQMCSDTLDVYAELLNLKYGKITEKIGEAA